MIVIIPDGNIYNFLIINPSNKLFISNNLFTLSILNLIIFMVIIKIQIIIFNINNFIEK